MRRCPSCLAENLDGATECVRCRRPLASPVAEAGAPQGGGGSGRDFPFLDDDDHGETTADLVALAAALPVQVRRSKVPVLSVSGRPGGGTETETSGESPAPHAASEHTAVTPPGMGVVVPLALAALVLLLVLLVVVLHAR